jgi:hypothetical protein
VLDDGVLTGAAEHRLAVGDDIGHRVDGKFAGRGDQGADQRRGDPPAGGQSLHRAFGGHPVEGQFGQVADEHPGAGAALLGEPGRVDYDQLAELGQHGLGQELQQVLGVPGGVDDQHARGRRRAAEEVDRLDDGFLDQHDPVGIRVLVDEPVEDRLVGEPGVPAHQAVGAVRVVDVVAHVLGVVAEPAGGGGDAGGDVTRFLVHDDPAGPDSELVMHGALASKPLGHFVYRRQDTVIVRRRHPPSKPRPDAPVPGHAGTSHLASCRHYPWRNLSDATCRKAGMHDAEGGRAVACVFKSRRCCLANCARR